MIAPGEPQAAAGPSRAPYGPLSVLFAFAFVVSVWFLAKQRTATDGIGTIGVSVLFFGWLGMSLIALRYRQGAWFALGGVFVALPFLVLVRATARTIVLL